MRPDPSGLAHSLSPVDLPEPLVPLPHPLRWTSTIIALSALTLALLNAHAIRGWAYQLPPSAASARVAKAAEAWHDAVGSAGLNRPGEAMRGWWRSARAVRFRPQPSSDSSASRIANAYSSSAAG